MDHATGTAGTIVVSTQDGFSHIVADEQAWAPLEGRLPMAMCGATVVPTAMSLPPGPTCEACLAAVAASAPHVPRGPTDGSRWMSRLLGRLHGAAPA